MLNQFKMSQIEKILSITSFTSIILVLFLIIMIPSATAYEISIYNVYPLYFWILISLPLLIASLKIIIEEKSNYYTFIVLGTALFSIFIILSLPLFRGYLFYGAGDTYTHLGMIKDIVMTGHVGLRNPYPIIHILIVSISSVLNVSPEKISLIMQSLFIFLYTASMFLLAQSLGSSKKESLFVLLFSIIPVMGIGLTSEYIVPSFQAFSFFPLAIFIFFKSRNSKKAMEFSILLVLLLILFAFLHPESMIFLTVFFVALYAVYKLENNLNLGYSVKISGLTQNVSLPLLLLVVASLAWFSSTLLFGASVQNVYGAFVLNIQSSSPPLVTLVGDFKINLWDVLTILMKEYGPMLIYLIVSFLISLHVLKNVLKGNYNRRDFLLVFVFAAFVTINLIFLGKGTLLGGSVFRQLKYPIMISTLLLGIYFVRFLKANKNFKIYSYIVIITSFVFILPVLSITSIYPSPSIQAFNYEPVNSDIQSMNFFFDHRDTKMLTLELIGRSYQYRISDYLYGYEAKKINLVPGYSDKILPPPHFGYLNNSQLGDYYPNGQYLLVYPPSLNYYPEIYPNYKNLWQYSPEDFEILQNDTTVNSVYSSQNFTIFIINPKSLLNH